MEKTLNLIKNDPWLEPFADAIAGRHQFVPVSYTHLDVYKRQELLDKHLIQEKEILHTQLGSYFRIMLFNAMIDWGQIVIPIDEKHLIL